jgi:hypothetical protein
MFKSLMFDEQGIVEAIKHTSRGQGDAAHQQEPA